MFLDLHQQRYTFDDITPDQVVMQNIIVNKVATMSSEMYKPGFETAALFPSLERTLTCVNSIHSFAILLENTDWDVVEPFKELGDSEPFTSADKCEGFIKE